MKLYLAASMLAICTLTLALASADVESGPKPDAKVGKLPVFAAVGVSENKEVDYAAERKDKPTVYLFVNSAKFSRPMNKFMKALDGKLTGISDKAAAVAVWYGGDTDKIKEYLPKIQGSVKYEYTALTVYTKDKDGPDGWNLSADAHITVVVVNKGKVVKSIAFESVNETDVKAVEDVLKKAVEKK